MKAPACSHCGATAVCVCALDAIYDSTLSVDDDGTLVVSSQPESCNVESAEEHLVCLLCGQESPMPNKVRWKP